jgi:hypothetical protein
MSNAYEYQKKAAACILLAEETQDIANRLILMGMAQGWLLLAEQADKNSHLDPTYATSQLRPPQPACTSTVAQQHQQQQQRLVEPEQDTEEK